MISSNVVHNDFFLNHYFHSYANSFLRNCGFFRWYFHPKSFQTIHQQVIWIKLYIKRWGEQGMWTTESLTKHVATPLWAKCEGEAHTPKSGKLESSGTLESLEREFRGQISFHLCALGVIGKILKCRCPKWPRMSHLDICSPSYGQKKGRESNWQFDSRPINVKNRPVPNVRSGSAT
jgi:hypothetical protein